MKHPSTALVIAIGLLAWIAAVGYPLVGGAAVLLGGERAEVAINPPLAVLWTTVAWSGAAAVAAALLGWLPGRVLADRLHRRGFIPTAIACCLPICLPAYLVFYAWWQAWPADSSAYQWAVEHQHVRTLRLLTLFAALASWSWPIVSWSVAGFASAARRRDQEMLQLDGAGRLTGLWHAARRDAPGLLLGAGLVFLVLVNNTTCFDLAEVFTIGNELRAVAASGGASADVLLAAAPMVVVTAATVIIGWIVLAVSADELPPIRGPRAGRAVVCAAALVWLMTLAVPVALVVRAVMAGDRLSEFWLLYRQGLLNTLLLAAATAAVCVLLMLSCSACFRDHRRWVRAIGHVQAAGWVVTALMPATVTAALFESAYNLAAPIPLLGQNAVEVVGSGAAESDSTLADALYRQPPILLLGHLARFGFVAALLAWWLVRREPKVMTQMRWLDGAESLVGFIEATWPRLLTAATATATVVLVMSMGEVAVTAQLQPPGFDVLAGSVLNAMHYQRPETVLAAVCILAGGAGIGAIAAGTIWGLMSRHEGTKARRHEGGGE